MNASAKPALLLARSPSHTAGETLRPVLEVLPALRDGGAFAAYAASLLAELDAAPDGEEGR